MYFSTYRSGPLYKRDQSDGPFILWSVHTLPAWEFNAAVDDSMQMPLGNSVCASNVTANVCKPIIFFKGGKKAAAGVWKDSALTGTNNGKSMEQWCWMVPGRLGIPIVTLGAAVKCGGRRREKAGSAGGKGMLGEGGSRGADAVRGR